MKNLLLFAAFLLANCTLAQCPYYSTCPTVASLFCDYSINDALYWKAAPYTWNPSLMLSDLPEGDVDLSIVALDSCGGQNILVEYTLLLDLDGNDTAETVIRSNATLSGKVLYNNILSLNYALGDTIAFDHRTGLPDSMKYRFGLETTHFADSVVAKLKWTTGIENLNYSVPKLPLGKHHILWRLEQGGVERFCEYGFELKDCAPPVVTCATLPTVNLLPTGNISLWASDFVESTNDNITPSNLIELAVRKSGTGVGFPLDDQGNTQELVTFDCCELGAQGVEVWGKDKAGLVSQCTTYVIIQDGTGFCPTDNCCGCKNIIACARTEGLDGVEEMRYKLEVTPVFSPPFNLIDSLGNGCAIFYFIPLNSAIKLTPSKNDNPLNGVTTYDLVLMSKHILAIEPLNSPNKMIAADANKSGSITTFDIVEIRRLILGIYTDFPNNTSWRFVDKDFQFPNTQNPFQTVFPETVVQQHWTGIPSEFNFASIKVGDVNNTAVANASTPPPVESRRASFLALPDLELKTGETYEIPIHSTENAHWLGLQLSLDFDPELIDIEGIESSTLPDFDQNNWAQPQAGRLTLSWSEAQSTRMAPSAELFRLRIKARADIQLSKVFKTDEKPRLYPEAYELDGVARPLKIVFSKNSTSKTAQIFIPQPNPTTAGATLPIQLLQAENIRLEVFDGTGKLLWDNELKLEKGSHALEIPASVMLGAEVYFWRVQTGGVVRSGKIIKG
ncbi:MAG: T9SS type A sorting domain-containing protein [Phycisphaerae bacterium]|nr:T9SS type A sorting domain-containing protein [Saprospiraceae bacterium]